MSPEPTSLPSLLQACANGNEPAWYEFTERFNRIIAATVVKTLLAARIQPAALADDLIQDVYLRLCAKQRRALREFEGANELAFQGFLRRVAYNAVQDHLRNRKNRPHEPLPDDLEQKAEGSCAPEAQLLLDQIAGLLDQAGSPDTTERDKTLFLLYFRQGMSARTIASLPGMGLSEKGVESALLRMTRYLRARIAPPKGSSPP